MAVCKIPDARNGGFHPCSCGGTFFHYLDGQQVSVSDLLIRTEKGCVKEVRFGRYHCMECGLISLVVIWVGSNGDSIKKWVLPIGKDISGE